VWVLTRANNRHAIEQHAPAQAHAVKFLYYDLAPWVQQCKRHTGNIGVAVYYLLWQKFAVRFIRRQVASLPFDIVHHVTFASVRCPTFLGTLGIPLYFGPVGGGEMVPARLSSSLHIEERAWEWARGVSNRLAVLNPLLRRMFRQAAGIFVTPATLPLIPQRFRSKCHVHLAIGSLATLRESAHQRLPSHPARLLFVGRLVDCKGIEVALLALQQLRRSLPGTRLTIIGDGPSRAYLMKLHERLLLEEAVEWLGWLPREELEAHYLTSDVLVFPALRDSGGMAVLEALAHGLPVVCTDLGGPGVIVNETCGCVVPSAGKDKAGLADCFAEALMKILVDHDLLSRLSQTATHRARDFDFQKLVATVYGSLTLPTPCGEQVNR
jgi:glycosyltransferase involved in cell wall biosynthesis